MSAASTGTTMARSWTREEVRPFVGPICEALRKQCSAVEVVGDWRRRDWKVGILNVLAVPPLSMTGEGDVDVRSTLASLVRARDITEPELDRERGELTFALRRSNAPVLVSLLAPPAQIGVVSLLKTGPWPYVESLMVSCRYRRRVVMSQDGSLLARDPWVQDTWPALGFVVKGGALWRGMKCSDCRGAGCDACKRFGTVADEAAGVIQTPTEESFYAAIGARYIEPWDRGVERVYRSA